MPVVCYRPWQGCGSRYASGVLQAIWQGCGSGREGVAAMLALVRLRMVAQDVAWGVDGL